MKSSVIIKGNKYGFQIVLNPSLQFEELRREVETKFSEADRFFDENRAYAISFEGRDLTPGEQNILVDTISACCRLHIGYIIDEDSVTQERFARLLPLEPRTEPDRVNQEKESLQITSEEPDASDEPDDTLDTPQDSPAQSGEGNFPEDKVVMNGQFYRGTLRSGQKIEVPGSIVILGDINPGAQVIAGGNVVVLGCLKGIVYAGYPADRTAIVVSLLMDPMQIQIGEFIARAPDEHEPKKRFRRKKNKAEEFRPTIAFIEDNNIIIDSITKELISEMSNLDMSKEK